MDLTFVTLVVVVIIVIYPDNVVITGGVQDGPELCVIVVLVMISSFQGQRDRL